MASRLLSVSKNIFGKALYSNIWIAISFGLISQVIGYTKYEGYFDLYWIIMKDGYLYFNLYPSFDELSAVLFIRVFLAVFVFLTVKDKYGSAVTAECWENSKHEKVCRSERKCKFGRLFCIEEGFRWQAD